MTFLQHPDDLDAAKNHIAKILQQQRKNYRVTIFGSARVPPHSCTYKDVRRLASELTLIGCDIVTGGGPGLMEAANEGSVITDPQNLTQSIGIRVELDFEQASNPFVEDLYMHPTFFSRLHHFALISDAFVVVSGGIGTALEAFTVWQLLQVNKLHNTPFIMVGEMWLELVSWVNQYMVKVEHQLVSPEDLLIPICVDDIEEAIRLLTQFQAEWNTRNQF